MNNQESQKILKPYRWAVIRFVGFFGFLSLGLFVGYSHLVHTSLHQRYLHTLGIHTTSVLTLIGDKAHLEPGHGAISDWVSWHERAEKIVASGSGIEDAGPILYFRLNSDAAFSYTLSPNCGAIPLFLLYGSAIFAFSASWRKRLVGVVAGIGLLYGINVVRLAMLAIIGAVDSSMNKQWFLFFHETVWPGMLVVIVGVIWLLWLQWVMQYRKQETLNELA